MLTSLNSMLFGNGSQEKSNNTTSNVGERSHDNGATGTGSQADQGVRLSTAEEEMGWLMVNLSRSSSPLLPESAEKEEADPSLRGPDGAVFTGLLDLSSAPSSDSEEEDGEVSDIDKVLGDAYSSSSSPCASEVSSVEHLHADLSSSSSSLSVIEESNEDKPDVWVFRDSQGCLHTEVEFMPCNPRERLVESCWMLLPPPRFTGTESNIPVEYSPLENQLIEWMSVYASLPFSRNHHRLDMIKADLQFQVSNLDKKYKSDLGRHPLVRSFCSLVGLEQESGEKAPPSRLLLTIMSQCCESVSSMKQARVQQRCQKAVGRKLLSRSYLEHGNKARMAQSFGRKQAPARNRVLRPSGSKCGRYCQRAQ